MVAKADNVSMKWLLSDTLEAQLLYAQRKLLIAKREQKVVDAEITGKLLVMLSSGKNIPPRLRKKITKLNGVYQQKVDDNFKIVNVYMNMLIRGLSLPIEVRQYNVDVQKIIYVYQRIVEVYESTLICVGHE